MILWHYLEASIPIIILPIVALHNTAIISKQSEEAQKGADIQMEVLTDEESITHEEMINDSHQNEDYEQQSASHNFNANGNAST